MNDLWVLKCNILSIEHFLQHKIWDNQPVDVLQNHVVPQVLLRRPVVKVLSGKPQIEPEPGHEGLYPLLGGQKRLDVLIFQSGALLANEYVVHVDQDHPV